MLIVFAANTFFKEKSFRNKYLIVLGILLFANIFLAYFWIPSSHFIYIMWGAILLYLISLYNHFRMQ